MKLLYALGGGLGHLTRGSAFFSTLNLDPSDFVILTNQHFAYEIFTKSQIELIPVVLSSQPVVLQKKIASVISTYGIDEFYIDSFPMGIIGELNKRLLNNCHIHYIARNLNLSCKPLINECKLKFENTWMVENLNTYLQAFIKTHSKQYTTIHLQYPEPVKNNYVSKVLSKFKGHPWIIVHSSPFHELEILYKHTIEMAEIIDLEPEILIISREKKLIKGKNIIQIDYFPAIDFFPHAGMIFSACGFNTMVQTKEYSLKHIFIPFPRKFDDQFYRAAQRKEECNKLVQ